MDNEALRFVEACEKKNIQLSEIKIKEVVSDDLAFTAEVIINNMKVEAIGDALLYAASLNVLNTYVKQSNECKKTLGYGFKKNVDVLLHYASNYTDEMMKAEIQKDKDMSLCILEINTIQFSYHNIDLNDDNRKLIAKDLDHPTLEWDGIRKQMCSVSLFDFAKNNVYGRTNKMLDGSGLDDGLTKLLDDYHNGKMSLSDSKQVYYSSYKTEIKKHYPENGSYPFRDNIINVIYQSNIDSFRKALHDRTLFNTLFDSYNNGFGFTLSSTSKFEWKYALDSLEFMFNAPSVDPSVTIGFVYVRLINNQFPVLLLTSHDKEDNDIENAAIIQMLPWEKVTTVEKGVVEYVDSKSLNTYTTIHPSGIMSMLSVTVGRAFQVGKSSSCPCTYLFNTTCNEFSDIVNKDSSDKQVASPIFYAEDRDKLFEYVKNVLEGKNGEDIFSKMFDFKTKIQYAKKGEVTVEGQFASEAIEKDTVSDNKKLYVINERHAPGTAILANYIAEHLDAGQQEYTLFNDVIPEDTDQLTGYKNILICDFDSLTNDEYEQIKQLETDFVLEGNALLEMKMCLCPGYIDNGFGINYIVDLFRLCDVKGMPYHADVYPIKVINNESEYSFDDGIWSVEIPEEIKYDQVEDVISMSDEYRHILYKELLKGTSGLNLLIRNTALRVYISNAIDSCINKLQLVFGYDSSRGFDARKILKFNKELLQNSEEYRRYAIEIQRNIGINAWDKLTEDSKSWVVTSMSEYNGLKAIDPLLDFSGCVLLMSKTFETELVNRIAVSYVDYIKNKYPEDYLNKLPDALIDEYNGQRKVAKAEITTLGSIPFIMGVDSKGRIKNSREYDEFCSYAKDELFTDKDSIDKTIQDLCSIVYYVRVNFRNTSAHKDMIDLTVATDCIEYCITEKRKLGVVMDIFVK